jgi:ribosomal protein S18 acetylase RimI-like enzyme
MVILAMIKYTSSIAGISPLRLRGFFVGWSNKPSPRTHLLLLKNSGHLVLAVDEQMDKAVGFITAVSDGVLSAYIPLLEVLPEYQKMGIGQELVKRMLKKLKGMYMVDLLCDKRMQPFYMQFKMSKATGMMIRNRTMQSGRKR